MKIKAILKQNILLALNFDALKANGLKHNILSVIDFDALKANGKRKGYLWWQKQYTQAKRWPVPVGKDPGEAFALGVDLAQWIYEATPFQRSL